jgi:hypothetical protein
MNAWPDCRKRGYLDPGACNALEPDELYAEQCSVAAARSRFTRTRYFVFEPRTFFGIKAVGVWSEWYINGKRSHYPSLIFQFPANSSAQICPTVR